ncbi:hypothetical protein Tco_0837180, partial [Tanacetum coccineum]
IDVHGEEMILRDGNERLILNMINDTSSYSNEPHQESINMIDIYNVSHEEIREDLFATNHPSGNPTSLVSTHTNLTLPEVNDDIFDPEEDIIENLINQISLHFMKIRNDDLVDTIPEEFTDELAPSDSFPPGNNDMTPEDVIKEVKCLLTQSPLANYSLDNDLINTILEMFTDEHALDYSSPPLYDDVDDDLDYSSPLLWDDDIFEPDNDYVYDDPFDFKEEKIKESKLLIDKLNELDPPESSDLLPFPECDSVFYEDFSEVDALPSTDNEDKVF